MQEMKPCPFCGNPKVKLAKKTCNYISSYDGRCVKYVKYSVRCGTCYARGGLACGLVGNYDNCENDVSVPHRIRDNIVADKELQSKAIELWNRRIE